MQHKLDTSVGPCPGPSPDLSPDQSEEQPWPRPVEFRSAYDQGFARVAAVTLPVVLADPAANAAAVVEQVRGLSAQGVCLAVLPELCLSGRSAEDLLLQDVLEEEVLAAVELLRVASQDLLPVLVVGAPLRVGSRVLSCGVVIQGGTVHGVVPRSCAPGYRERDEHRLAAGDTSLPRWILLPGVGGPGAGCRVSLGTDLLFTVDTVAGLTFHVEVGEDALVPVPPSSVAALAGATVLVSLSGSPVTVGRAEERRLQVRASSARNLAACVCATAGQGESTTDLAWDGQTLVCESGTLLGEGERFPDGPRATVVDVDVEGLRAERLRQGTFEDNRRVLARACPEGLREVHLGVEVPRTDIGLRREVSRFPFVPDDPDRLAQDCHEAYSIQVAGLEQRLRAIGGPQGAPKVVVGVSGGLDSTQALIVAARAMDRLGRPRSDILAYTMPGFATSATTRRNAEDLATGLGCTFAELDIRPTATQMLAEIGHPYASGARTPETYDVTFENVQAGLRTDFLFRLAGAQGGVVLGTGDLSELALGWCTFGVGDHMSHYGVNAGVPKTLIQHLIRWVAAERLFGEEVSRTLLSVLDTEISPELVPAGEGEPIQSSQSRIGPYALQDFTLWHVLVRGSRPSRIAFLAERAWADAGAGRWPRGVPEAERVSYDLPEIRRWLEVFYRRFFASQFKRSTLPDGPRVVAGGSLSPRGDWRMPSDATATAWLAELERNVPGPGR